MTEPKPPKTYQEFIARFPELGEAWDLTRSAAERAGPLSGRMLRLVKLGIAIGALREGAVRSAARRARADGVSQAEIGQVVASAASTIGLPGAVAAFSWTRQTAGSREVD